MSPALVLLLLLAAASASASAASASAASAAAAFAATAAAPQQLPTRGRPQTLAKATATIGGPTLARRPRQEDGGSGSARIVGLLARPALRLLGTQLWASTGTLQQLAELAGAGSAAPLYRAALGASSGSAPDPAALGAPGEGGELADLVV